MYEYVYEDEIETTPSPPFVFREAVIEMENEEGSLFVRIKQIQYFYSASGFTDDFTLPEQKSKVVITEVQLRLRIACEELSSFPPICKYNKRAQSCYLLSFS